MKKTPNTENCKNRKIRNKITFFCLKPYVKNDIFEKRKYFSKTTFFNKKIIMLKILHQKTSKTEK